MTRSIAKSNLALMAGSGLVLAAMAIGAPAFAQEEAAAAPSSGEAAPAEPSPNAMSNLIRLLVEQGVIKGDVGQALMVQAEQEAAQARAKMAVMPEPAPGAVRIPYVPQVVKDEIRDEVRREVLAKAEADGWATPGAVPEWVDRIKISGDIRVRSQSNFYSAGNAIGLIDYNAWNARGPINSVSTTQNIPLINSTEDRINRMRIRARLGIDAEITKGVRAGVRIATGSDNGPTSTTSTLGGGFGKQNLWLDRAYVSVDPIAYAGVTLGRFANPFWTSDILFDEDVNFDGVAVRLNSGDMIGSGIKVNLTGGAFPYEYLSTDAPTNSIEKLRNGDKWIYGGQLAAEWKGANGFGLRGALAYFDFHNVQGQYSEPCFTDIGFTVCSTDQTRPAFMNKGNSLAYLRNIVLQDPGSARPQYVGLLFDYNILEANLEASAKLSDDLRLTLGGTYIKNLAYDEGDACSLLQGRIPLNNIIANNGNFNPCSSASVAEFRSGDSAWMLRGAIGTPDLKKVGNWNVSLGYKRIEPDAVLDSLADSDFHLGGTNAKGFVLSGSYMLFDNVRFTTRYLSANEVYGEPLGIDVLQVDLTAGF